MTNLLKDWLGPEIERELRLAVEWLKKSTEAEVAIKQEPGPKYENIYENDGSNLRVKIDRGYGRLSAVQIIEWKTFEDPIEGVVSDGRTSVIAKITPSVAEAFCKQHLKEITDGTRGGIMNIPSFEIVATHLSSRKQVSLRIQELNWVGSSGSPTLGHPRPIEQREVVSELIEKLRVFRNLSLGDAQGEQNHDDAANDTLSQPMNQPVIGSDTGHAESSTMMTQMPMSQMHPPFVAHLSKDAKELGGVNLDQPKTAGNASRVRSSKLRNSTHAHAKTAQELLGLLQEKGMTKPKPSSSPTTVTPADRAISCHDMFHKDNVVSWKVDQPSSPHISPGIRALNIGTAGSPIRSTMSLSISPNTPLQTTSPVRSNQGKRTDGPSTASSPASQEAEGKRPMLPPPIPLSTEISHMPVNSLDDCSWLTKPITRHICIIPKDQERILDRPESWIPSEPGKHFPYANVPHKLLTALNRAAESREQSSRAVEDPSLGAPSQESFSEDDPLEDRRMTQDLPSSPPLPWTPSPSPQNKKTMEQLPPDSSLPSPKGVRQTSPMNSHVVSSVNPSHPVNSSNTKNSPRRNPVLSQTKLRSSTMPRFSNDVAMEDDRSLKDDSDMEVAVPRALHSDPKTGTPTSAKGPRKTAVKSFSPKVQVKETPYAATAKSRQALSNAPLVDMSSSAPVMSTPLQETSAKGTVTVLLEDTPIAQYRQERSDAQLPLMATALTDSRSDKQRPRGALHPETSAQGQKRLKQRFGFTQEQRSQDVDRPGKRQFLGGLGKPVGNTDLLSSSSATSSQSPAHATAKQPFGPSLNEDKSEFLQANMDSSRFSPHNPPPNSNIHDEFTTKENPGKRPLSRSSSVKSDRPAKIAAIPSANLASQTPSKPQSAQSTTATASPLAKSVSHMNTIYNQFTQAYSDYKGDLKHFIGLCRKIDKLQKADKMQHRSLWDDFIVRHKTEYQQYVVRCSDEGEDPIPYERYYRDEVDESVHTKRIMNPSTLKLALEQSADSTPSPANRASTALGSALTPRLQKAVDGCVAVLENSHDSDFRPMPPRGRAPFEKQGHVQERNDPRHPIRPSRHLGSRLQPPHFGNDPSEAHSSRSTPHSPTTRDSYRGPGPRGDRPRRSLPWPAPHRSGKPTLSASGASPQGAFVGGIIPSSNISTASRSHYASPTTLNGRTPFAASSMARANASRVSSGSGAKSGGSKGSLESRKRLKPFDVTGGTERMELSQANNEWYRESNTPFKEYSNAYMALKSVGGRLGKVDEDGSLQLSQSGGVDVLAWKLNDGHD